MVHNLRSIRANSSPKILVKRPQYLLIFVHQKYYNWKSDWFTAIFKVSHDISNVGNAKHFHGQTLLKKILRKDKYWHNQLRKAFLTGENLLKKILGKDKYSRRSLFITPVNSIQLFSPSNCSWLVISNFCSNF